MNRFLRFTVAALALAALVSPATALAQVATTHQGPASISWSLDVANSGATLTVAGGGVWYRKTFDAGQQPSFSVFDGKGNLLPDGVYKWELSIHPVVGRSDERIEEDRGAGFGMQTTSLIEPASGTFRIANGSIVSGDVAESAGQAAGGGIGGVGGGGGKGSSRVESGPVTNDQVILDDLIVDGSICAGLDCVNGESFGFDTLRLKENNLRIKAQDTSSSASFPSNDWQITFNESSNGGLNKFSIDDIDGGRIPFTIEAGAPSHSLYVDDGGRIGLGTQTPVVEVHVKDGDTPTVRLEQDGSSGFTPQIWDMAGNETNWFVRDASNGSLLSIRVRPGAGSNSLFLDTDGDVGMGTSAPAKELDVDGTILSNPDGLTSGDLNGAPNFYAARSGTGVANMRMLNSDGTWQLQVPAGGAFELRNVTGSVTPFSIQTGVTNALVLAANGNLGCGTAGGCLVFAGTVQHPDYVFEPDYELMTIEEQAEYMLSQKHLPAVGQGRYDENGKALIDLAASRTGMLEELEKAHLYIAQLHERLAALEAKLAAADE